jgi:glycosyltransferase involved in cell wall biosynthesis
MTFAGMMRVRNEARWIERVIESLLPLCSTVYVMDDHSDDGTAFICAGMDRVRVFDSPFGSFNEARDKEWLLGKIREDAPDIVLLIDGDEVLEADGPEKIRALAASGNAWSFRVLYLWDSDDQIRTDGVYSRITRPSMFRLSATDGKFLRTKAGRGANLHCSSVPADLLRTVQTSDVKLWHLGYRDREDRLRKYDFYRKLDPGNALEDGYRHMVIGDVFPAASRFKHAGPLTFAAVSSL